MNKFLRIGFFSVALAQSLYGVVADAWWKLDQNNITNPPPPTGPIPISNPLVIFEDSTLNITTTTTPANGFQFYNGSITFDHNLKINLKTEGREKQKKTSIYRLNGGVTRSFNGNGILDITVDATQAIGEQIFDLLLNGVNGPTLNVNVKTNITATEGSRIFSILRNEGGKVTFNNDLIVDLSKATGELDNNNPNGNLGITNAKAIFDNTENGIIIVNPNSNSNVTVQLTGDIATYVNSSTTINLSNSRSFYNGKLELAGGPMTMNLTGGSKAFLDIHTRNQTVLVSLSANNSSLYADFTSHITNTSRNTVTLNNAGLWYISQSNTLQSVTIDNVESDLTKDNFEHLNNLSAVDFRYTDKGKTLRTSTQLDQNSRHTLTATNIQGQNGVFRLFGVLNTGGWTPVNTPAGDLQETVATDQVIATTQVFGTNYIQLFWNQGNFDKSLINTDLKDKKIIVAKQENMVTGGNFVGAITPIGVYNYITNLEREIYNGANGPAGWQWIVTDVQRADNSYLSKLLDSIFQTQFRIYKTQIDTLNLRMGELRKLNRVHGVWLRSKYGRLGSKETNQTTASWDEYASIWLGYDQNFFVLGGKNFLGGSFDVNFFNSNGIPDKDDFSNPSYIGQSQSYGFSVYDTFFFDNGFYIDALAKYYFTHNKFIINSEILERNTPEFYSHNFYAQLEVGKRFKLPVKLSTSPNDYLYLKPDAGMSFAFSSGQDWNFMDWSNQLVKARLDFNAPVSMRTGLTFGWTWNSRGYEGDLYAGTSFEYDFNTGGDLRLEDFLDRITLSHGGNFNWRINAGTNVILNEYWRIYFDVDTAFFGTINSTFTLNAGVRINFGRLHPQMPYIPPYMDAPSEDFSKYPKWRRTIPEVQNYETEGILENYSGKKKRKVYQPKVIIKQKPFEGTQKPQDQQIEKLQITPQVEKKPTGAPEFIDNPTQINAPSQNYKRDTNVPMYQNSNPAQNRRSMEGIRENYNRGYR